MHRIVTTLLLLASAVHAAYAIYINGTVITVDPADPYAETFAVTNGRFSAVGTTAEIRRLATPSTKIVDLKGMTVTPGFNDVHLHPTGIYDENSPYYVPWLGPEKVHNIDDLIAALKAKAAKTPPGQLVSGTRYQDTKLGRHPTVTTSIKYRPSTPSASVTPRVTSLSSTHTYCKRPGLPKTPKTLLAAHSIAIPTACRTE